MDRSDRRIACCCAALLLLSCADFPPPEISGPEPDYPSTGAVDRASGELVVWTPRPDPGRRSTWAWRGGAWAHLSSVGPDARSPDEGYHLTPSMVYDEARGTLVLYGGGLNIEPAGFTRTTRWDGSRWTPVDVGVPPGSPRYRALHAMAYDSKRGVTWLYGGREPCDALPSGEVSCETLWFLDGEGWHRADP